MTGPRIITRDPDVPRERLPRSRYHGQSGVRMLPDGRCIAVADGRFAGEFVGKRAFLAATRAAGSSTRLP